MVAESEILAEVRVRLRSQLGTQASTIHFGLADGDLTMGGTVDDIVAKKLLLERAAEVKGVGRIIGRLHVRPSVRMSDGQIRDRLREALRWSPH